MSESEAARRALATSEARLRLALTGARAGAWEWDLRTGAVVWSPELYALLGVDPLRVEASFEGFVALLHPEERDAVLAEFARVSARGRDFELEYRVVRPLDGAVIWLSSVGHVEHDAEGRAVATRGINLNVTTRRQAEEALRQSEASLRAALARLHAQAAELRFVTDQAPVSLAHCDADGRFRFVNRTYAERFGLVPEEVVGKHIVDVVGAVAFESFSAYVEQAVAGRRVEFEVAVPLPSGTRFMRSAYVPEPGPAGARVGFVAVIQDVTERKAMDEQVWRVAFESARAAEANAKFRTMFEQGTQFAGILSLEGVVIEANRLCLDACGYTREEVMGRPFWDCGWWNRAPELVELVRTGSLNAAVGLPLRTETRYYMADGSERMVDLSLAPVTDETGHVLFVAATGTDVTDRKQAEDELRDAHRRKDEFIATLAHELRNPLAPIRTALEVMKRSPLDGLVVQKAREMMERQLGHMVRLIDDLLDLSRISRGRVELRKERVQLSDVIDNAIETSRPIIDASRHELSVSLPAEPVWLDADLTRLAQVLSNVLTNAAKYTPPGGRIELVARRDAEAVVLSVTDTGVGIPPDMLVDVFAMFAQLDKGTSGSHGGLGIGLALVKLLVELHGGTVRADSAGRGRGSTFTLRLPSEASEDEPAISTGTPLSGAQTLRQRILVVDDNVDGAEMLASLLEIAGHETRTAHDGPEALAAARAFAPDTIFLDIGLPGMDGFEVAERLRAEPGLARTVLVALTGWGSQADKQRSKAAGFDFHLTKPVDLSAIESVLGRARS